MQLSAARRTFSALVCVVFEACCGCVAGDSVVTEEQTAVIAGVPQAAFADNVQYQFRTENNGGQVRSPFFSAVFCFPSQIVAFPTKPQGRLPVKTRTPHSL